MNRRGLTLIEIMAALAIASTLILIAVSVLAGVSKDFAAAGQAVEWASAIQETRLTLGLKDQCSKNFEGIAQLMSNPGGEPVTQIRYFEQDGTPGQTILRPGMDIRGGVVKSLRLKPQLQQSPDVLLSYLEMEFTNGFGQPSIRTLPVFSRIEGGVIRDCWTRQNTSAIKGGQICSSVTDGALNVMNPNDGSCTLAKGKWFAGSSASAKCPAGTYLPGKSQKWTNCKGTTTAGWTDAFPYESITFSDGSTQSLRRPALELSIDLATDTCTCDWASDIPIAQSSAFTCEILCFVP